MIRATRVITTACAIAAAGLFASPAGAQQGGASAAAQPSVQSALASDAGTLSDKFTGLARVMAGKYDWRPGQGVRSVGEVFNLILNENRMLSGLLTNTPPPAQRPAPITDPAQMQEALKTSYSDLRKAIEGLSAADMGASVKMFGRDMTKQGAALLLLMDQHEHLGQSIAYARTNSIVPPWSK